MNPSTTRARESLATSVLTGVSEAVPEFIGDQQMALPLRGDRNQCCGCGEYFNSSAAFDKHRHGDFGKDRRCRSVEEMRAKGMDKNAAGFWVTARNPMDYPVTPSVELPAHWELIG
jgi:hypothetical protein